MMGPKKGNSAYWPMIGDTIVYKGSKESKTLVAIEVTAGRNTAVYHINGDTTIEFRVPLTDWCQGVTKGWELCK